MHVHTHRRTHTKWHVDEKWKDNLVFIHSQHNHPSQGIFFYKLLGQIIEFSKVAGYKVTFVRILQKTLLGKRKCHKLGDPICKTHTQKQDCI